MVKLRKLLDRLNCMTDNTYYLLRGALMLSCTMAGAALVLFLASRGGGIGGYEMYKCAQELFAMGAVTMLVASIASVCVEELTMRGDQEPPRK